MISDTFTKYVWVEALKNKTAKECTKGIIKILKKNQPKLLQTDNGTEFYNNEFQSSWNWINSIFKLVYNYNNTKHSTIKCSPHEARINPVTIKRKTLQINTSNKLKFKINDKVRISKYKHNFSKGYTPNWSTEVFTISKILNTDPLTYQLKDSSNNIILGCFYTQELKKTFFPDTFLIERIIKKNKNKLYVKWLG
ncbi:uncharacterized protein LOC126553582 [Aphis gossypii]|uniref:uncharacterized protein LOC126553582 n=1 Tax=Aphis gossypii TaxID=80765 RepID=UPI002158B771|nr:uncharacterized protein LOC126553582 [Aphis gossypii]